MKSKTPISKPTVPEAGDAEALYLDLLTAFYEQEDRARARKIASRLEEALASSPDFAESIRGDEVRSLIAELRGDLTTAIRSREAEIRRILELQAATIGTPAWDSVAHHYDFSDVSDRLDLLAALYDRDGDTERAIATLRESRQFCETHRIPFDGQEMLEEFERARGTTRKGA